MDISGEPFWAGRAAIGVASGVAHGSRAFHDVFARVFLSFAGDRVGQHLHYRSVCGAPTQNQLLPNSSLTCLNRTGSRTARAGPRKSSVPQALHAHRKVKPLARRLCPLRKTRREAFHGGVGSRAPCAFGRKPDEVAVHDVRPLQRPRHSPTEVRRSQLESRETPCPTGRIGRDVRVPHEPAQGRQRNVDSRRRPTHPDLVRTPDAPDFRAELVPQARGGHPTASKTAIGSR